MNIILFTKLIKLSKINLKMKITYTNLWEMKKSLGNHIFTQIYYQIYNKTSNVTILKPAYFHNFYNISLIKQKH